MNKRLFYIVSFIVVSLLLLFFPRQIVRADDVYNVTDPEFGAVADDSEDDYQAIQKALNKAAGDTSSAITVKIPEGKYYISKTLVIHSNTTIEAEGAEIYGLGDNIFEMIYGLNEKNIVINGGTWDVQSSTKVFSQIFSIRRADDLTIKNATFQHATNHYLNISASHNVLISNCVFHEVTPFEGEPYDYWGEDEDTYGDYRPMEAIHADFAGEGETSLQPADGRSCEDVTVENCYFHGVYSGIGNHHKTASSRAIRVKVLNCTFDDVMFTCMYGISFDDFEFSGNTCRNVGTMFTSDDCSGGVISGNILELPDSSAQYSAVRPPVDISDSKDIEIYDNTFEALNYESILLNNDKNISVLNNIVKAPTEGYKSGNKKTIQLNSCTNCTVEGNNVDSAVNRAIYIYLGENVAASGNTITYCGSEAPLVIDQGKNHKLDSNTVITSTDFAIAVYASENATVSNNIIKDSTVKSGIFTKDSSIKIASNSFNNSVISENGIFCQNCTSEVTGNTISSPAKRGIFCDSGSKATVSNNTITGSPEYGISINYVKSSTVSGNTVNKATYAGIQIYVGSSVVENNNVKSGKFGIYINGYDNSNIGTAKVINNTIDSPRAGKGEWFFGLCLAKYARNVQIGENSLGSGGFGTDSAATYTNLTGKWSKSNNKWYYMDTNGNWVKGWKKIDGVWYFFERGQGAMQTGWVNDGGTWYHMKDSGAMETGWQSISGKWYYFNSSGAMQTGWQKIGGAWYYFNGSGAMETGWEEIGGKWYYFDGSGAMQTGWKTISGKQYYFKSSGAMAAGEWVEGFWWIGSSGVWSYQYKGAWHQNSRGWWFGDESGWYAKNESLIIKDVKYTFDADGYIQ